jgi:hypothetical protein
MQRAAILSTAASPAPQYVLTLSHKLQDFREKVTEYQMCVLIFSTTLFERIIILRRIQRDNVIYVKTSSCTVPVILVGI